MSSLLNNFKLDNWWKVVLLLGVLCAVSSFTYTPDFIEPKKLFGLSLGMILIGLSYIIAERTHSWIKPPNMYTGGAALITEKIVIHNLATYLMFGIGIILVLIFGFLIIKGLF